MRRRPVWLLAASLVLLVFGTRWPFRSRALFDWDSANFALALLRIDIGAHRPHPPGYLGYVFAARALNGLFHDANMALVVWNVLMTALSALLLATFASETAQREHRTTVALAAVAVLVSSPLLWFYGEIAEIYPSELFFSLLVVYTGWRAVRGEDRAMSWCVFALALTAAFKIFTAILILPCAVYAWTQVSAACRRRSIVLVAVAVFLAAVIVLFLAMQRDLAKLAEIELYPFRWLSTLFQSTSASPLRMLNRNIRDLVTASVVALGVVNVGALSVWLITDRRLPPGLDRRLAILWLIPWVLVLVFVLIAKPGYVLPVLPLGALVVAGFYARLRRPFAIALITAQALVNVGHFLLVTPVSQATTGGAARYKYKTWLQRTASDLQALTFPTSFTIAQSDARVDELLSLVSSSCPDGDPIVIADIAPVDWRRVMWYLPSATAVHLLGGAPDFIGKHTDASPVAAGGVELHTRCPVIWLAPDEGPGGVERPDARATPVPHLGWMTGAGTLRVTRTSVELE